MAHKTKVWSNDDIWGWSCTCGASDNGWNNRLEAAEQATIHSEYAGMADPDGY